MPGMGISGDLREKKTRSPLGRTRRPFGKGRRVACQVLDAAGSHKGYKFASQIGVPPPLCAPLYCGLRRNGRRSVWLVNRLQICAAARIVRAWFVRLRYHAQSALPMNEHP